MKRLLQVFLFTLCLTTLLFPQKLMMELSGDSGEYSDYKIYNSADSREMKSGKFIYKTNDNAGIQIPADNIVTLTIAFPGEENPDMVIFNETEVIDLSTGSWNSTHSEFTIDINPGTYDFLLINFFHDRWIIKENISINANYTMNLNFSVDASCQLQLAGVDQNGTPLANYPEGTYTSAALIGPANSALKFASFFNLYDLTTFHFTPFSSRFTLLFEEFQTDIEGEGKMYLVQFPAITNLTAGKQVVNQPSEYKSQLLKLNNISTHYCFVTFGHEYLELNQDASPGGIAVMWMKKDSVITSWQLNAFVTPRRSDKITFGVKMGWFESNGLYPMSPAYVGQSTFINGTGVSSFFTSFPTADLYIAPSGETMQLGTGVVHPYKTGINNYTSGSNIASAPRFCGGLKEYRVTDNNRSVYKIYDASNTVIANGELGSFSPMDVPAGTYKFETKNSHYFIRGANGEETINQYFDLTKVDATSPFITNFRIENSNGVFTDALGKTETGKMVFSAGDFFANPDPDHLGYRNINGDSTKAWYRKNGTVNWTPLPLTYITEDINVGYVYNAAITSNMTNYDSAEIDIKISVVDESGNKTELIAAPAFAVRNTIIIPVELTSFNASVSGKNITLNWSTATETNNKGFEVERLDNSNWIKIGYIAGNGTSSEKHFYSFEDVYTGISSVVSYRLKQIDFDGSFSYSNVVTADLGVPVVFSLEQNYPNPFNPSTNIRFALPVSANVKVRIYNSIGEELNVIFEKHLTAGNHQISFDGSGLTSGVYIYAIEAAGDDQSSYRAVKKMMLIK